MLTPYSRANVIRQETVGEGHVCSRTKDNGDVEGFCNYTSIKREQDGEKDDSIQTYLL